jgi:RHS repeat-associated protein
LVLLITAKRRFLPELKGFACKIEAGAGDGNRTTETNANHLITRYEYDELGRHTRTIYPNGSSMTVAYDRLGRRVSETDAAGQTVFFAYDELSRLTGRQDHLGNITRFGYDPVGRLTSQTDANNQTTTFEYDCLGRRHRVIQPSGATQRIAYDAVGRRLSETDANTNSTFFTYDASGRLLAMTNALGYVTRFDYDLLDRLVTRTDALGRRTTFEYDALGRRTRTIYPDGAAQNVGYDTKGRRIRETDPAGNSTLYAYDDNDRLIAVTNALNEINLFGYDATGRLMTQTDALGRTTVFEYDALDRPTRTVYADGTARGMTYDVLGRRMNESDQAGIVTSYGYDPIGRLTAVTNALGEATFYGYDPLGRLIGQTNANGHATTFAYDSLGRRIRRTLPGGQTETYGYDSAGNLISRTNLNGHVTSYSYNALNQLTAKIPEAQLQADGSAPVTFAYDALGQRTNMVDASGSTEYRYDVRNRLVEKIKSWAGLAISSALLYGYDANGNVAAIRSLHPNGTDVTYSSDALNRVSVVNESRLGLTTYSYDPVGNWQSFTRPNGVQSFFQYDSLYRLTNLGLNHLSTPVANYEYTVGPAGHRLSAVETLTRNSKPSTISRTYGYDAAYRLTREIINARQPSSLPPNSLVTYEYDAGGNRHRRDSTLPALPSATHQFDANDRLFNDRYDANGNTTNAFVAIPLTGQTNEVFDGFDFEDRLFERRTARDTHPSTINVLYDGDGNRVAKTVATGTNSFTTLYLVDDLNPTGYAQVLEELTSGNAEGFAVTRVYTWGHALLSQDQFMSNQWTARFHGQDGRGSVRFLTDTNGTITDTFDYDSFGNLIARGGGAPNNYLFAGEQFDSDLNLYYLRARYAEPNRGRFWTPDSFEGFASDPASLHRYTFNQNDPVNRLDPSGHVSLAETFAVSTLAPLVRGMVLALFNGVNNYSYGLAGGDALKFTTREEAYFIDSLAVGPGWKFGKENFWAAARGAPFLLSHNPNIWQGKKACWYECIPFDLDAPVYGPSAEFPMFEMEPGELYQELGDWKHGSMLGATLHSIAGHYQEMGDAAYIPWLPSEAQWVPNFANYMASSVAGLLEAAVSPQSYVDGWRHVNNRAYQTILREFESGGVGPWAFAQGLSTVAGDVFGYNSVLEGSFGVDRGSLAQLGTAERWTRGFAGLSQIAGSIAGGLRMYNPSIGGARLGAATLADAPSTALVAPETKLCLNPRLPDPGLRRRVLAAIEESKLARQASRFDEFEARTQTATQLEFGFVPFVERESFTRDFYRIETRWADSRIARHLRGIDFNQPVEIVQIPRGSVLNQHGFPSDPIGNYFSLPGTPAKGSGIYPHGRVERFYQTTMDLRALRSTAADITDTWSVPGWAIDVPGGKEQFFIPNNSLMRRYP